MRASCCLTNCQSITMWVKSLLYFSWFSAHSWSFHVWVAMLCFVVYMCGSCRYLTLRCVLIWRCVWSWCADRVITWHWGVCSSNLSDRRWSRCVDCVVTWHRGGVCSSDVVFDRGVQTVSLLDTEEVCARLTLCLIVVCSWHRGGVCSSDVVFDRGVQIVSLLDTEEVCARLTLCLIVVCRSCHYLTLRCVLVW